MVYVIKLLLLNFEFPFIKFHTLKNEYYLILLNIHTCVYD